MGNFKENNNDNKRKKIAIFLAFIGVFSLITLGVTSNLFGKIGTSFRNKGSFEIGANVPQEKEIVKNKGLVFDKDTLTISLSSSNGKLSFTRNGVLPEKYTCETENANVASCYVANGYVVVLPKNVGSTVITLKGETGSKVYVATSTVTVTETDRYIDLASKNGVIDLNNKNTLEVPYYLIRLDGKVTATSSNEKVAKATIKNNLLVITASQEGSADIKLSVTYNEKVYTAIYHLEVVKNKDNSSDNKVVRKSHVSTLKSLTLTSGTISFDPNVTEYSVNVDKNLEKIGIHFETTNENAKVLCTVNGIMVTSLKDIPLQDGSKEVKINVISEDGQNKKTYTIIINKLEENSSLVSNIKINDQTLEIKGTNTVYKAVVKPEVTSVNLSLGLNDSSSSVKYIVDNKVVSSSSTLKNLELTSGRTKIKVVITTKRGISFIYLITIEREKRSNNADLSVFEVIDSGYDLEPISDTDDTKYKVSDLSYEKDKISLEAVCDDPNCKGLTSEITYPDGTKKELTSLNNIELKEGKNIVSVVVTAEDGETKKTYTAEIYRPIRKISFNDKNVKVLVEKEYTDIAYTVTDVKEDGTEVEVTSIDTSTVKTSLSSNTGDLKVEVHDSFVRVRPVNPKELLDVQTLDLTATYDKKEMTTTLNFDIDNYVLTGNKSFNMSNSREENTKVIILNTNLLDSTLGNLSVKSTNGGKTLKICSNDEVYCVKLSVDDTLDDGDITLSYDKDAISDIASSDLPIVVTAHGDGKSTIHVTGSVYGKSINKDFDIEMIVTKKYVVTILANAPDTPEDQLFGRFNAIMLSDEVEISKTGTVDLSTYDEPYKIEDCKYYKFKEFKVDGESTTYQMDGIVDGSTLTHDITIYAVYKDTPEEEDIPETNSLWLVGVDLFDNPVYEGKYGIEKMIYPGAEGSYEMEFTATDKISIKGITLKEDTICVAEGCLNMGYMVHYNEKRTASGYESVEKDLAGVKANKEYWILNKEPEKNKLGDVNYIDEDGNVATLNDEFRGDIKFDEAIDLEEGDQVSITIFWKWDFEGGNDDLDTKIGNEAAKGKNKYSLSVGIIYDLITDDCPTS